MRDSPGDVGQFYVYLTWGRWKEEMNSSKANKDNLYMKSDVYLDLNYNRKELKAF